ncbi:MAG: hypothetical protein IJC20_04135, partial [Clostridia bacterium]|nr:hypothetical protein [Clostridia bacterium]
DVAPDYFYDETKRDVTIKQNGTHYQYEYKIINGKTYVEFFVDLASVRCANNDNFKMFVYALHDTEDSGTAMGKYAKLYYPSLKTEEQKVQNLFWVTDYNSYGTDIKYGAGAGDVEKTRVLDNIGIIFDNFKDYNTAANEYKWWYQVCFKKIGDNQYKVAAIQPSQGELEGNNIAKLPEKPEGTGTYLWYAMNTGDYYSANYWQNGNHKLLAPLDKRNYMATEAFTQLKKWRIGDVVEFNFDFDDIKTERTVISYDGRMYNVDNATQMNVLEPRKVTTSEPTIQDVGHTRGQYVKFVIENDNMTWLAELAVYAANGTTDYAISNRENISHTGTSNLDSRYKDLTQLVDGNVQTNGGALQTYANTEFVGMSAGTHEFTIKLTDCYDIHRFAVSYNDNPMSMYGIGIPESIKAYVSFDGVNWTYATDIPIKSSALTSSAGNMTMRFEESFVYSSGANAEAYYSPFTVTRTFSDESMKEFYARRNAFMPTFEKYGIYTDWMYGTTTRIVSAAHIAPDVVKIDGLINDTGWSADKWIKADATVNATNDGANIKSQHQIRTDGEYLYVSALVDSANPELTMWFNYNNGE